MKAFSFPLVNLPFNLKLLGALKAHWINKSDINGIEKNRFSSFLVMIKAKEFGFFAFALFG